MRQAAEPFMEWLKTEEEDEGSDAEGTSDNE